MRTLNDMSKMRERMNLPPQVEHCRYVGGAKGKASSSWSAPGPTDYWVKAYCEMSREAWQALGIAYPPTANSEPLSLPRDVAEALLPADLVAASPGDTVEVAAVRLDGNTVKTWGKEPWQVAAGFVVGAGLLVFLDG